MKKLFTISTILLIIISFVLFFYEFSIVELAGPQDKFNYYVEVEEPIELSFLKKSQEGTNIIYSIKPSSGNGSMEFHYSTELNSIIKEEYLDKNELPIFVRKKEYSSQPLSFPLKLGKNWYFYLKTEEFSPITSTYSVHNDTYLATVEKAEALKVRNENLRTLVVHFKGSKNEFWWWISDRFALPVKIVSVTDGETITTVLKDAQLASGGISLPVLSENQRLGSLAIGILSTSGIIAILIAQRRKKNGKERKSDSISKTTPKVEKAIPNQKLGSSDDVIQVKIKTQPASKPTQSSLPVKSNSKDDIIEVKLKKK